MSVFKKVTMKDQVYEYVREKIMKQEYSFGSRINIDLLSSELHVSNTPIREALIMLQNDGLLTIRPNVGAKVIEFTEMSYQELNTAICTLLFGTYEICVIKNGTDQLANQLRSVINAQRQQLNQRELFPQIDCAMKFDKSFFAVADNHYLSGLYEKIESLVYLQILDDYRRANLDIESNIVEHERILAGVEAKNTKEVKHWLQKHYNRHLPPSSSKPFGRVS